MRGPVAFLLLILCGQVLTQKVVINPEWTVTQEQLDCFVSKLSTTPVDQILYHWGDTERAMSWISKGFISEEEMLSNIIRDEGMLAGGGLYLSSSPVDSIYFGVFSTSHPIPQGTLLYNASALVCFNRTKTTLREKAQLGSVVPFIDQYRKTWSVVHSHQLTKQVYPSAMFDQDTINLIGEFGLRSGLWNTTGTIRNWKIPAMMDGLDDIYRLFSIFCYMDGIQVRRLITTMNTTQPWKYLDDQEDFKKFHRALTQIWDWSETNREIVVADVFDGAWGSKNMDKQTWIDTQTSMILPKIWNMLTASEDDTDLYRSVPSRRNIRVTASQLQMLQTNKYLTLGMSSTSDNGDVLAIISHPEIMNLKSLYNSGVVSESLYQSLCNFTDADMRRNTTLQFDLNKRLLSGMFAELLSGFHGRDFDSSASQFMLALASLRPFSKNQMGRLYYQLANWSLRRQIDLDGLVFNSINDYISDFLLLSEPKRATGIMSNTATYTMDVISQALGETLKSTYQLRERDFSKLPAWNALSAQIIGKTSAVMGVEEWSMVKRGDWLSLFDRIQPSWRTSSE